MHVREIRFSEHTYQTTVFRMHLNSQLRMSNQHNWMERINKKCRIVLHGIKHLISKCFFNLKKIAFKRYWSCAALSRALPLV